MIGFGALLGCAGILHIIGIFGLVGGIHIIAWHIIYIGSIAIGIIIIILFARTVRDIIIILIINRCVMW